MLEPDEERSLKEQLLPAVQHYSASQVTTDDFHLRGMYLCNSARDYYYSRFTPRALDEIAELLAGRPVLVGHDYGTLPVGRFVSGEKVERRIGRAPKKDSEWVKGLFYVPKDAAGDALVKRIDMGIYREVSIGWRCLDATCSECGNDMRDRSRCEHFPGEVYEGGLCEYRFSGVTAVLEGSLVFAGGQKDTSTFVPEGARAAAPAGDVAFGMPWSQMDRFCRSSDARDHAGRYSETAQHRHRSSIVSISCERKRFEARSDAARWVRDHDFRADRCEEGAESFTFEQRKGKAGRALNLDDGVRAMLVDEKPEKPSRALTVEQFLKGGA